MKALRESRVHDFMWVQPSRGRRGYEMHGGDDVFAWLSFQQIFGNRAIATTAEGQVSLHTTGRLNPVVHVSHPDSDFDVAVFRGRWDGPGTLTFRDGRAYQRVNTNWIHTEWLWTSESTGKPLLHCKRSIMTIVPDAASPSDLALVTCLSEYLQVLQAERVQGATTGAIISMMQSS